MTNQSAPTMAELFQNLTQEHDLPIKAMTVKGDAHLTFGEAVHEIPKNLPAHVLSGGKEVPIVYHTMNHS
ncbi:MAG: hypothetical protein JWO78_786 [Micavibrio sp.]|nr:hypothetical protein [Micavibrio sp.]